ncbi:hypothetical protein [Bifidobacterium mongoliense]|uniref:Uncharacterized protein n=1 Tax=Bifidobacterium mongoliense DSM 21395 TaxID=1437603 RepID=A0A087BZT0_9BIFI|nr:hypothetical protein [Bifidobacterium mongoliense]KFI76530.1 hypothetical protein BMON_1127 [Bifidobacterium mongoliense DSM 21395]
MTVIARDDVTLALVTDVASTAHYFQLKASTASAPTAPTVYPAPSPWVTTEPTYTEGATNSLYTVDVTVFSDGMFDYTPVSLSSSYEAAKAAYNKAKQAQSAATAAQTTADGKNKIFSSASEPSHTGLVAGDLWFQLDTNKNVTGIKVWNGTAYANYVLMAQQILVAGSIGTISLANGAVTADKVTASEALLNKLLVRKIKADDIDVGSLAAAIITSGEFQTASSGARVVMDTKGIRAYDAAGNTTFQIEAATGKASLVGGMQTALSGKRISISQSGDTGKVALLNDGSELSSLTFIDDTDKSGYVYTGLYTGQSGQFMQFATLVDSVNHQPDPKVYDVSITARGKMLLDASNAINVNGTWFAHDLASLPTAPQVVGGQGTKAFVGGIEYAFDGGGAWVSQTHTWDDAVCVAVPTSSSSTVNGTTSVRMDTMTGDSAAYTRGSNYIQVAHAGTYLVSGAVQVSGVSGGSHHANVAIGVDGYSSSNRYMSKEVGGGPGLDGAWITAVYPAVPIALTAGQRVYLIVACDVAGAVIQPNGCLLSITRIGD